MNVVYHAKAVQEEGNVLKQATAWLEEVVNGTSDPIEAEWDRVEDEQGHIAYVLKLRDFAGETEARFVPEELTRTNDMRFRVFRLLGELLRIRNHKLLRELREANREGENGAEPD